MFIRKTVFQKLIARVEKQDQEIDKLQRQLGILALSLDKQFSFEMGEGWKLVRVPPDVKSFIEAKLKTTQSSDS
jgi:hypothetical protein